MRVDPDGGAERLAAQAAEARAIARARKEDQAVDGVRRDPRTGRFACPTFLNCKGGEGSA